MISFRAVFLIIAATLIFHLSPLQGFVLLVGYVGCASLDKWLANRERDKLIECEISGWNPDPKKPEYEDKGNLTRLKLPQNEQIIVTRVAELLRRIP